MNILGIETSCDETAAAIVRDGHKILSNVVSSSLSFHQRYGGIIPEIASRKQLEFISYVLEDALKSAHVKISNLDGIAVTSRPGLIGSLLVGTSFAQGLAYSLQLPLVSVDHIIAHLYAPFLNWPNESRKKRYPQLPAIGLIVSGGHSSLFLVKNFRRILLLGQTRDDAAGEAYDKVARLLGLGYPGGPILDRLAQKGHNNTITFPCAELPGTYDFSFSGIKTAVHYFVQRHHKKRPLPIPEIAYSFQKSVVGILTKKTIQACLAKKIKTLVVGGGVAANSSLRQEMTQQAAQHQIHVFFPDLALCMDNAAMIAGIGFHHINTPLKETCL